jgi:acetyl esterase/lipase
MRSLRLGVLALALSGWTTGTDPPEETRPHDARSYVAPLESTFEALPGAPATFRWAGTLDGAAYRIEVPRSGWNGRLLMWAHGYVGQGSKLVIQEPIMRRHLIEQGYAWAASSYRKNNYDVRGGIEDTNALAQAFTSLAAANGQTLAPPSALFIAGASMGGHIAAAAVERETLAYARHFVRYSAALPMCGVLGDTEFFNYFAAYQLAAMQLAGMPARTYPVPDWQDVAPAAKAVLWTSFPAQTTERGRRLMALEMNLSGGERPFFAEGFADLNAQNNLWRARNGTLDGVLTTSVVDTRNVRYRFGDPAAAMSAEETWFNDNVTRAQPDPAANRLRRDGLRWVPVLNGEFDVPVLTLHTLGDLYVPLRMEQIYRQRAMAHGSERWLVQRVVRDVGHCAFTEAEVVEAFEALVHWVDGGTKPIGDDVLDRQALAAPDEGCRFTRNQTSPRDLAGATARAAAQAHYPACPSSPVSGERPTHGPQAQRAP